jgi:hypothetical protein
MVSKRHEYQQQNGMYIYRHGKIGDLGDLGLQRILQLAEDLNKKNLRRAKPTLCLVC